MFFRAVPLMGDQFFTVFLTLFWMGFFVQGLHPPRFTRKPLLQGLHHISIFCPSRNSSRFLAFHLPFRAAFPFSLLLPFF